MESVSAFLHCYFCTCPHTPFSNQTTLPCFQASQHEAQARQVDGAGRAGRRVRGHARRRRAHAAPGQRAVHVRQAVIVEWGAL